MKRTIYFSILLFLSTFIFITHGNAGCKTDINGLSISGTKAVGSQVTFSVDAASDCNKSLYYKFSIRPDYGTNEYNDRQWSAMTESEWVSTSSIGYTFGDEGKYVVTVWVVDDTVNVDPAGVPIAGISIDISDGAGGAGSSPDSDSLSGVFVSVGFSSEPRTAYGQITFNDDETLTISDMDTSDDVLSDNAFTYETQTDGGFSFTSDGELIRASVSADHQYLIFTDTLPEGGSVGLNVAVKTSENRSNTDLNGTFRGFVYDDAPATEYVLFSFDGTGGGALTLLENSAGEVGLDMISYTVHPDGKLDITNADGEITRGVINKDGTVLIFVDNSNQKVGIALKSTTGMNEQVFNGGYYGVGFQNDPRSVFSGAYSDGDGGLSMLHLTASADDSDTNSGSYNVLNTGTFTFTDINGNTSDGLLSSDGMVAALCDLDMGDGYVGMNVYLKKKSESALTLDTEICTEHQDLETDKYFLHIEEYSEYKDQIEKISVTGPDVSEAWSDATGECTVALSGNPSEGDKYFVYVVLSDDRYTVIPYSVDGVNDQFSWIITPTNGEIISTLKPTFSWNISADNQYYNIIVQEKEGTPLWEYLIGNSTTTSIVFNVDGNASKPLEAGKEYEIYLHAHDSMGNSAVTISSFRLLGSYEFD